MKQENQQILGILAIIFGAISLLGSWIPIINYLSLIIAVPTLILGIIGIVLSPKKQKTLAILGTSFALIAIIVSIITQFLFSNILNDWVTKYNHTYRQEIPYFEGEQGGNVPDTSIDEYQDEDDIEEDQGFTWTQDQFDALVEGDISNRGQGGAITRMLLTNMEFQTPLQTQMTVIIKLKEFPTFPLVQKAKPSF